MVETNHVTADESRAGRGAPGDAPRGGHRHSAGFSWAPSDRETVLVACVVLASAVGAALVHARPTGSRFSDIVVAFVVGGLLPAVAARARPWAWAVATGAAALGGAAPWSIVAFIAFAACIGVCAADEFAVAVPRRALIGAAMGAVATQTLFRMPTDRLALDAALFVAAAVCLISSGRAAFGSSARAWIRPLAIGAAVIAGLAVGITLLSGVQSRHSVDNGIAHAQQGLKAARAGDSQGAAALFVEASNDFRAAHHDLAAWWTKPALIVPGVGQQARALDLLSQAGTDLANAAAIASRSADLQSLRVHDGRLDLARVEAMQGPVASVSDALDRAHAAAASAQSPWLLSPVASRLDDFSHSVDKAADDAQTAAQAVAVLPDLLGAHGPRQYFVVFATPSETRDLGGFMGAYGILTANNGKVSLKQTSRVGDLNRASRGRKLTDPSGFPSRFLSLQPQLYWQDVTGTSDFPTVARAVQQMWPQTGNAPIDGVLYLDPETLAALMKLTGPVSVPGYAPPLTADTAVEFLLRGQYEAFPEDDRHEFLVDAAKTVFDKLTTGVLPSPKVMGDTLAPAINERRLMFYSVHPDEQALFERLDVAGAVPPVAGDFLSIRAENRGLSKIDSFMHRTISDEVTVDPAHNRVYATVTVTIVNDAPATGLPTTVVGNHRGKPPGTNSTTLALLTPLQLVDVTSAGKSIGRAAASEYGRSVYTVPVDVPAGGVRTVVFQLEGPMDLHDGYHLTVVPQPLANADHLQVDVRTGGRGQRRRRHVADVRIARYGARRCPHVRRINGRTARFPRAGGVKHLKGLDLCAVFWY